MYVLFDLEYINGLRFTFGFFSDYPGIAFHLGKNRKSLPVQKGLKAVLHSSRPFDCIIYTPSKGIVIALCKTLPWAHFAI